MNYYVIINQWHVIFGIILHNKWDNTNEIRGNVSAQ